MVLSSLRRRLYRGRRAGAVARMLNRGQARLAAAGIGPTWLVVVETVGRRSGRTITFPAVVADYEGDRYLVSMLGADTNWVRNVRASGGRAALRHGRREPVRLVEVEVSECAPIGARAHIPVDPDAPIAAFEGIAADYPVFRVTTEEAAGPQRSG